MGKRKRESNAKFKSLFTANITYQWYSLPSHIQPLLEEYLNSRFQSVVHCNESYAQERKVWWNSNTRKMNAFTPSSELVEFRRMKNNVG